MASQPWESGRAAGPNCLSYVGLALRRSDNLRPVDLHVAQRVLRLFAALKGDQHRGRKRKRK